jgi:hypothetical protein
MITSHTSGPWVAEKEKNHRHVVCSIGEFFICTNETPQDIEADARLIAAAPELLEACKKAIGAYDAAYASGRSNWTKKDVDEMRSAIAKAEGSSFLS